VVDPELLPQVRVADCHCIIPADGLPIGYLYKLTPTGDVRVLVYACAEHDRTKAPKAERRERANRQKNPDARPTAGRVREGVAEVLRTDTSLTPR
jgi:hypothetical protein